MNSICISVEYRIQYAGRMHELRATGKKPPHLPPETSLEHFFKEHRWGFGVTRRGRCSRYEVAHSLWNIYPIQSYHIDVDWGLLYGPEWELLNGVDPCSTLLAVGSTVAVYPLGNWPTGPSSTTVLPWLCRPAGDSWTPALLRHLWPRHRAGPCRRAARAGAAGVEPRPRRRPLCRRPGAALPGQPLAAHRHPRPAADPRSARHLARRTLRRRPPLDWSHYLTPDHTLAVDCNVRDSHITHSKYAALKTKDAICDQFVERFGRRPSVDVEEPMVGLNLHIYSDQAVLSLDSSGDSLHKRGYRPILTKRPLNEALAAARSLLTGWRGRDARSSIRCAARARCRSRRAGSPCSGRRG